MRDGAEAVRLAQRAVSIEDTPKALDTLAAAYAETGQFAGAVGEETKAIAMAQSKHPAEDVAPFQSRLKLYQRGAPFRH